MGTQEPHSVFGSIGVASNTLGGDRQCVIDGLSANIGMQDIWELDLLSAAESLMMTMVP